MILITNAWKWIYAFQIFSIFRIHRIQAFSFFPLLLLCISVSPLSAQSDLKELTSEKSSAVASVKSDLIWLDDNYVDNPANFHERALQTLAQTYQLKDDQLKGEAHQVLMRWHAYHVLFTIDSIYQHGEKALTLFKQTNDQTNLAATSSELAFEYVDDNDLKRSEDLIFEAIRIYENQGDEQGLGETYNRLAHISLSQNAMDKAIQYSQKALKLSEKVEDHTTTALAWLTLLLTYLDIEEYEKAIHAGNQCIETVQTYQAADDFTLARAYAYRGDTWAKLGDYQNSLEDNKRSYAIVEAKIGPERPAAKTYRQGIGTAYYMQGKYQEALPHLEATVSGYVGMGQANKPRMHDVYSEIADCYYQLGDYKNAFDKIQLAQNVLDTMMQNKVANLESEAFIKYESGKKDQALAEQANTITQNNRVQWLGMGLISLLLLFLGTLFYYYRRNQKISNDLLIKNKENELLLKEIHHRVKNNLQTVSSLLSLQSESISDKNAFDAVQESKNRVASMALIHQKLYQGENLAAIEMRDYFNNIGKAIIDSFGEKAKNIALKVEMNRIELDVDTAIPIGLITNELITNSLKHAFANNHKGEISINLVEEKNGLLKLNVADNGAGNSNESIGKKEKGFGTLLVQLLTTQLGGKLKKLTEVGTSTIIQFPKQEKSIA